MRRADVEDGLKPGTPAAENAELREAKKRIRLLEQENEVPFLPGATVVDTSKASHQQRVCC